MLANKTQEIIIFTTLFQKKHKTKPMSKEDTPLATITKNFNPIEGREF